MGDAMYAKAGRDGTSYGSSETVGDFYPHHAAAISMAPVRYEAEAIVNGATKREARLAYPGCPLPRGGHLGAHVKCVRC